LSLFLGELAALGTALGFSVSSTLFALAGRRVGPLVVNRTRLILAVGFLAITHLLFYGTLVPLNAAADRWMWLGLSGVIGLVVGDGCLYKAFVLIGPRIGMLIMSLAPVMAALFAWLFYAETLSWCQIFGIFMTLLGIAWVIVERHSDAESRDRNRGYWYGISLSFCAATCQAMGLIMAKRGLYGEFSAISGNMIRMIIAASALVAFSAVQGRASEIVTRLTRHRRATLQILGGAMFGPLIAISLSLVAIQLAPIGIASAIMQMTPIFLLPIGYFFFRERFGWGAIAGTVVAIIGVAVLFLL
jgi:drug/metabolite transporter (DMT)-like permease